MNVAASRGRWIPWVFAGGMLVVIAVNTVLITAAFRSFPGLVVQRPYDRGIAYNDQLRQRRAQADLGWRILPHYESGQLVVRVLDARGVAVADLGVGATLSRPLESGQAIAVSLVPVAETYAADLPLLRRGQWDIAIDVSRSGETYRSIYRILVP